MGPPIPPLFATPHAVFRPRFRFVLNLFALCTKDVLFSIQLDFIWNILYVKFLTVAHRDAAVGSGDPDAVRRPASKARFAFPFRGKVGRNWRNEVNTISRRALPRLIACMTREARGVLLEAIEAVE